MYLTHVAAILLVDLYLDTLKGVLSKKEVNTSLKRLQSGPDAWQAAYDMKMERIESQPKNRVDVAKRTLAWVLKARRPLSILEFQYAIAITPGSPSPDSDAIVDVDDILAVCAGLVIADKQTDRFRFVHSTLQTYLEYNLSNWLPKVDAMMAQACVDYLDHTDVSFEEL